MTAMPRALQRPLVGAAQEGAGSSVTARAGGTSGSGLLGMQSGRGRAGRARRDTGAKGDSACHVSPASCGSLRSWAPVRLGVPPARGWGRAPCLGPGVSGRHTQERSNFKQGPGADVDQVRAPSFLPPSHLHPTGPAAEETWAGARDGNCARSPRSPRTRHGRPGAPGPFYFLCRGRAFSLRCPSWDPTCGPPASASQRAHGRAPPLARPRHVEPALLLRVPASRPESPALTAPPAPGTGWPCDPVRPCRALGPSGHPRTPPVERGSQN